jgi:HEAT repeat protein
VDSEDAWQQLLALSDAPDGLDEAVAETLVHLLHQRGEPIVVEWALPALADPSPGRRQAAAWVLGQLGYEQGRPFADQVMPALAAAARSEQDDDTRQGLVAALGHADDPVWVPELLSYVEDGYPAVRQSVAGALPIMFAGDDMSADAVEALITLTRDSDPEVRDWATFSLGNQGRADSDAIRDALAARLDDDEGDTRFEAAVGLARRGDPRALAAIAGRLEDESATIYLLDLDAAAELADPVLLPGLERLRIKWTGDDDAHAVAVSYAIARCEPATHDLAKRVEPQFVDAVNRALIDVGWTITSSGEYPLTILTVRRPDGSLADNHDATLLWDGVSPTDFNLVQEVASWVDAIQGMAAESPQLGPVTDEDSA